jgi:hypothetical protein
MAKIPDTVPDEMPRAFEVSDKKLDDCVKVLVSF